LFGAADDARSEQIPERQPRSTRGIVEDAGMVKPLRGLHRAHLRHVATPQFIAQKSLDVSSHSGHASIITVATRSVWSFDRRSTRLLPIPTQMSAGFPADVR
jgi:hypothetical protein